MGFEFTVDILETEERVNELKPFETLKKVGFEDGMTLCDIGAGSGVFSFPAAEISSNNVFALELNEKLIDFMNNRAKENKKYNLIVKKVVSNLLPMEDKSVDMALMTAVFHGIDDKQNMLREIKRILKKDGKLLIIEFHKEAKADGPPLDYRLSPDDVKAFCEEGGFKIDDSFDLGENNYFTSFKMV